MCCVGSFLFFRGKSALRNDYENTLFNVFYSEIKAGFFMFSFCRILISFVILHIGLLALTACERVRLMFAHPSTIRLLRMQRGKVTGSAHLGNA